MIDKQNDKDLLNKIFGDPKDVMKPFKSPTKGDKVVTVTETKESSKPGAKTSKTVRKYTLEETVEETNEGEEKKP